MAFSTAHARAIIEWQFPTAKLEAGGPGNYTLVRSGGGLSIGRWMVRDQFDVAVPRPSEPFIDSLEPAYLTALSGDPKLEPTNRDRQFEHLINHLLNDAHDLQRLRDALGI